MCSSRHVGTHTLAPSTKGKGTYVGGSSVHGLLVEDVSTDSPAADAGVQPGDVIQEVNRQQVLTVDRCARQ
jgi:S1-C subfamily serine protease